mmetsp:Transcript_34790/g.84086  ORF Transcript_34790/g.84086 Transcript_34790/m.84086 type:complete len:672 (+) Transcript_34790:68-2083(+)
MTSTNRRKRSMATTAATVVGFIVLMTLVNLRKGFVVIQLSTTMEQWYYGMEELNSTNTNVSASAGVDSNLSDAKGCTEDAKVCDDGATVVVRDVNDGCRFYPCPHGASTTAARAATPSTPLQSVQQDGSVSGKLNGNNTNDDSSRDRQHLTSVNGKSVDTSNNKSNSISPPVQVQEVQVPVHIYYKADAGLGHRLTRQATAFHFAKAIGAPALTVDWGWCADVSPPQQKQSSSNSNDTSPSMPPTIQPHIEIFRGLFEGEPWLPTSGTTGSAALATDVQVSLPGIKEIRWDWTKLAETASISTNTTLNVNATNATSASQSLPVVQINFLNDVAYYSHTRIVPHIIKKQVPKFYGKDQSDVEMYDMLRSRFRYIDRVRSFQQRHDFANHTVLGLHLRLGNGERFDFQKKRRGISPLSNNMTQTEWLSNLGHLIVDFWVENLSTSSIADGRPPLIFISTDSSDPQGVAADLKVGMQAATSNRTRIDGSSDETNILADIPVVTMPQLLVPDGKGVSYAFRFETKEECIESWASSFCDLLLLSESDILFPGLYSSFTQTMPLSYHLAKKDRKRPGKICNVGVTATVLECFDDYLSWFEQGEGDVEAYRLPKTSRLVFGDKNGKLQYFHKSARPMMPYHPEKLKSYLSKKMEGYPVSIIPRDDRSLGIKRRPPRRS